MKFYSIFFVMIQLATVGYTQIFNYYSRNEITGSYVIKNIENTPPEYKIVYEFKDNKVIGYYYDSCKIKFIDELKDNRIQKIVYYDKNNASVIFEKTFYYDAEGDVKSFEYILTDPKKRNTHKAGFYFLKEDDSKLTYNACGSITKGSVNQYSTSEGIFSTDYKPVKIKTKSVYTEQNSNMSETFFLEEFWSYNEIGAYTYKLFTNDSLEKSKEIYFEETSQYINEYFYNSEGNIKASKKYSIENSLLTQEFFTGNEVTREQFSYQEISDNCFMLKFIDWNKVPCIKIETMDEVIYIKSRVEENLKLNLDIASMVRY